MALSSSRLYWDRIEMASPTTKEISHIAKFDGTNFPSWKYGMWMFLEKNKLTNVMEGTEKRPLEVSVALAPPASFLSLSLSLLKQKKMREESVKRQWIESHIPTKLVMRVIIPRE